ncbi:MAG: hypothetical protein HY262_03285 [Chloroflexi bacterium]|nr:hypothetical protein [Chloroflexota bacterium]
MRLPILALLSIVVAACSAAATTPQPSTAPTVSPSPSTGGFGAIEHATGPTDVVLRFEQGGGFVPPAFLATQAPIFTLYGDGTVLFRNPAQDPLPAIGSVVPDRPFRTARLTEDQIQGVLEDALGPGGLGAARTDYRNDQIADAPTAVFTVNAGGLSKRVSIYALGMEIQGGADAPARAAFQKLAERLQDFDQGGRFSTSEYAPERYRGVLMDGGPGAPGAKPWPWDSLKPADFAANPDPNAFQLPARVLTVADVETLGIDPYRGGFQGLTLVGPDGKTYLFSLRPLLPDESS